MPAFVKDWSSELRKISHQTPDHNIARTLIPAILAVCCLLAAGGCQIGESGHTAAKDAADCDVQLNTAPWKSFKSMADRMSHGEAVSQEELEAYGRLPAVAAWRQSLAPNVPQPMNLANWLQDPWWTILGKPSKRRRPPDRVAMSRSFSYSHDHTADVDAYLKQYTAGHRACALDSLVSFWLSPENKPVPLVLNFLPAKAEIRLHEGQVFVDTGALVAGGGDQTNRSIATLLYRSLEAPSGTSPVETAGEQAVAECLRVMLNEGVAGWIEQTTSLEFDREHPALYKVHIVPEEFYRKARLTFARWEASLPAMFAEPEVMADQGSEFARSMAGSNAFAQTGIAMAELIVGRLGEERLREVRHSPAAFLAAYQQAALLNPSPAPEPGTPGIELIDSVPALSPEVFENLHALLERLF